VRHEEVQQAVLGGSQGNFALARAHAVTRIVELQTLDFDDVRAARGRRAPQNRLNAGEQLARRERLRDVVIRAALETADLVLLLGASGQHDHRDFLGIFGALQGARQLEPAHIRQHPIDEHQVGPHVDDPLARLAAVLGLAYVIPGAPQAEGNHVPNGLFVFDDEDALGGHLLS
jgi:hypothetical protein